MRFPPDGKIVIPSLKKGSAAHGTGDFGIKSVRILGYDRELSWLRDGSALRITVTGSIDTGYPVGFALELE
jgi:hypothetical protein